MMDKLFRQGIFEDIFSKMNEVGLSLQRKSLTVFVSNEKIGDSNKNYNLGKFYYTL